LLIAPTFEGPEGVKDSSALRVVHGYLKETSLGQSASMIVDGQIVIGEPASREEGDATWTLEAGGRFRFDIHTSTGSVSTRIDGMSGSLQREDMNILRIPMETAAAGPLITPWTMSESLSDPRVSISDGGETVIEGKSLFKVVFRRPVCALSGCPEYLQRLRLTTDLYFDSHSYLLMKSVDEIRLSETSMAKVLRVITYGEYRQADQSLVAHQYAETLDGQLSWTFAASRISLGKPHDQSHFHF
jgi:hypothetical protein